MINHRSPAIDRRVICQGAFHARGHPLGAEGWHGRRPNCLTGFKPSPGMSLFPASPFPSTRLEPALTARTRSARSHAMQLVADKPFPFAQRREGLILAAGYVARR